MTRADFIRKHRVELFGLVADAAVFAHSGAPLGIFLRNAAQRLDEALGLAYDELAKPIPVLNGQEDKSANSGRTAAGAVSRQAVL